MIIYFYGNLHSTPALQKKFVEIVDFIKKRNIQVLSNMKSQKAEVEELSNIVQTNTLLIEKVDGLIIEATNPSYESAHLIALALTHKKPVLYLAEKGKYIDKNFYKLEEDKQAKKYFRIAQYMPDSLGQTLDDFITALEKGSGLTKSKPEIKFTLRLTESMEKYLNWKSALTKKTKADFLRMKIEDIMREDEKFKRHLLEE